MARARYKPPDIAETFAGLTCGRAPLLGLDVGTRTIGVAACDAGWRAASPVETIRRIGRVRDFARVATLAQARAIAGVVVGLPLDENGDIGPRAQSCLAFGRALSQAIDRPVGWWDERFSTQIVEEAMIAADMTRARRAARVDRAAATLILQGAIDHLRGVIPAGGSGGGTLS